jgi:hypothetical protein
MCGPVDATAPDLAAYRAAVDDLMIDVAAHGGRDGLLKTEMVLSDRIPSPEFADLLAATPDGADAALRTLMVEVECFQPNSRSSADDVAALIRIFLLSQIDAFWWGRTAAYQTDTDVVHSPDLVDLDAIEVQFRYRRQVTTLAGRVIRAAERRVAPVRTPRTAGLRLTHARPEAITLIAQLADEFSRVAPAGTPPLWVTSLTRSIAHQHHLRSLGYSAMLPSSHCTGYGIDIEMDWYRRFDAHGALRELLLERQDTGDINVISEGQAWHVCISPTAVGSLREDYDIRIGG